MIISYILGNMFDYYAEAYVNTVNTVGVMGSGLALEFKNRYPKMFNEYKKRCKNGLLKPGQLDIHMNNNTCLINFPTKTHWKYPSELAYIQQGMDTLTTFLIASDITSIIIPPLGCGLGGLKTQDVLNIITTSLEKTISKLPRPLDVYLINFYNHQIY